jgi:hypothetical protein
MLVFPIIRLLQHLKYITLPIFLFKNLIDDTKLSHLKIKDQIYKMTKI